MVEFDKREFAEAVREVLKSYRQECGTFTLRMWWAALQQHDLATVLNAMGEYCASPDKCKFAPKAGDIVGMIEGTKADRKELAVMAFAKVIGNVNRYATVVFDDPAIHFAITMAFGSWDKVSDYNDSEFESQQNKREFITAYAAFNENTPYQPKLIGINERDNAAGGFLEHKGDTLYIGEYKKALAVELGGRTAISTSVGAIALEVVAELKAIA